MRPVPGCVGLLVQLARQAAGHIGADVMGHASPVVALKHTNVGGADAGVARAGVVVAQTKHQGA